MTLNQERVKKGKLYQCSKYDQLKKKTNSKHTTSPGLLEGWFLKWRALLIKTTINASLSNSYSHYGLEALQQWIGLIYKHRLLPHYRGHVWSSWSAACMTSMAKGMPGRCRVLRSAALADDVVWPFPREGTDIGLLQIQNQWRLCCRRPLAYTQASSK